jgi:hypothetical protein
MDEDGFTLGEIAEEMGISSATACRILKGYRLPQNPRGGALNAALTAEISEGDPYSAASTRATGSTVNLRSISRLREQR